MISLLLAAALAATDTPPLQTAPAPAAAAAAPKAADPNRRICKSQGNLGSLLPTRVCMTAAEWEERTRRDRETLENTQRTRDAFTRKE